ncbi:hypothetical protein VK86_02770 [Moellerella wisconsensis]|nr:hypothetical protein VK86_02770 [Moellerella wisconsensis]
MINILIIFVLFYYDGLMDSVLISLAKSFANQIVEFEMIKLLAANYVRVIINERYGICLNSIYNNEIIRNDR